MHKLIETACRCAQGPPAVYPAYAEYRALAAGWSDAELTRAHQTYSGNAARSAHFAHQWEARRKLLACFHEAVRAIEDETLARQYERRDDLHEDPADGDPFTQQEWDEIQAALDRAG